VEKELLYKILQKTMLDLRMNELSTIKITIIILTISISLFIIPFESHSETIRKGWDVPAYQNMQSLDDSFNSGLNIISANLQYQIRDISGGLACVVQSDSITAYDAKLTLDYLSNHPLRTTFENNGKLFHYVPIKESWTVGEGDTFLSALRNMISHPDTKQPYSIFFATTNGCAIQPGDKVTVMWEIVYH